MPNFERSSDSEASREEWKLSEREAETLAEAYEATIHASVQTLREKIQGMTIEDLKNSERRQEGMNALANALYDTYSEERGIDDALIDRPNSLRLRSLKEALSSYHESQIGLMACITGRWSAEDMLGNFSERLEYVMAKGDKLFMLTLPSTLE